MWSRRRGECKGQGARLNKTYIWIPQSGSMFFFIIFKKKPFLTLYTYLVSGASITNSVEGHRADTNLNILRISWVLGDCVYKPGGECFSDFCVVAAEAWRSRGDPPHYSSIVPRGALPPLPLETPICFPNLRHVFHIFYFHFVSSYLLCILVHSPLLDQVDPFQLLE